MPKFDSGMEAMLDMFVFETSELLESLDDILIRTEQEGLSSDDINEIFRIMHTVKGSSAMMGLKNMSGLAHAAEDLFSVIRDDPGISYDKAELYEQLYKASDNLKNETADLSDESVPLRDFSEEIKLLRKTAEQLKGGFSAAEKVSGTYSADCEAKDTDDSPDGITAFRVTYKSSCMMPELRAMVLLNQLKSKIVIVSTDPDDLDADGAGEAISKNGFIIRAETDDIKAVEEQLNSAVDVEKAVVMKKQAESGERRPETKPSGKSGSSASEKAVDSRGADNKTSAVISVKLSKLDRLMKLSQEIVIAQSAVLHNEDLAPYKNNMSHFYRAAMELKKLTDELQDAVMSVRMVPVSVTFTKMSRIVRDMNASLGKNIKLIFEGENTEVDKSAADMLGDPIMHLVRNAADHGIEEPEKRAASGKTEPPTITLSAANEANDIIIKVIDNGRGMDPKELIAAAKEKGILTRPETGYTDQEAIELIMAPGFSTNTEVTQYSGRGVGMDVVKKNLERIGGALTVSSVVGEGSAFTIRVPMSLSISDYMAFYIGGQEYALPVSQIAEVISASEDQVITTPDGKEVLERGGTLYRVIRIAERLDIPSAKEGFNGGIFIICTDKSGDTAAVSVDSVSEEMQLAVKPFPSYLSGFKLKEYGLSGTSVLGDGRIVIILDASGILKGGD